jgi:nicotinate-nucleotide pyrophosphorylase (carboxylating)
MLKDSRLNNPLLNDPQFQIDLKANVRQALNEDIRDGDITAMLIPAENMANATVITREQAIICGQPWVDEVFRQLDSSVQIEWFVHDGDEVRPNQAIFNLKGSARSLLTGERTALNFLQTLSGTATAAQQYAKLVEGSGIKILDTRKTIPGLRLAQKYAVNIGGCHNHRIGLYDAFLIKENHIAACGGINAAIEKAKEIAPGKPVEVEVENLDELKQALKAGADIIMLDNFDPEMIKQAIELNHKQRKNNQAKLEVSGNLEIGNIAAKAIKGIDYLSSGSLTKHCKAVDFSMRFL